jgi:cysteine synthase A
MTCLRHVDSVLELIGNTPVVELNRITEDKPFRVFTKLEYMNPSGSLKDRIVYEMIKRAEREGDLNPGDTIIEASTGNTGAALGLVGRRLGYEVEIYMPEGMTPDRKRIMEAYGAKIIELERGEGGEGSIAGAEVEIDTRRRCLELECNNPDMWWARQFSNPANVEAHVKTGRELLEQLDGEIDVFVASIGVGGTLYGVAKALKEKLPDIIIVGAEPASARYPISEGYYEVPGASEEVTGGIIKEMMESGLIDRVEKVGNGEAIDMAEQLVTREGLFCGVSSGANVYLSLKIGEEIEDNARIATVLPDSRDRYLTEKMYTT